MARLRRKQHGSHENHERWLLTYADLITLLLVFFVVMYAISKADERKFERFSSSIQQAFHVDVVPRSTGPGSDTSSSLETDPRFVSFLAVRRDIELLVSRMHLSSDAADVELTREGIVIHLSDAALFPPGQAQLRPDAVRILDGLADIIGPLPNEVRVEGHTDNVPPPDGSFPDNWELSVARAVTTVRYLSDMAGISPARLAAVGYGEHRPRADNDTLEGRRKNRRVDFVIVAPEFPG